MIPKNPYYILELAADASPGEIERQGRKILGLLEIGAASAAKYVCPLGTFDRDATMVREAMAVLRDPRRRAKESCLAKLLSTSNINSNNTIDIDAPLGDAFLAGGYRGL